MHELTIAITAVGLLLACWVVVHYGALLARDLFFEDIAGADEHQDLADAEGEALPPADLDARRRAAADAAGIVPSGCWGTVWSDRARAWVDCSQAPTSIDGLCRVHAEILDSIDPDDPILVTGGEAGA